MVRRPTAGMFTQNSTKPVGLPSAALPPTIAEEEVFSDTDSFVTSQNKPAPETKNTPASAPTTAASESARLFPYVTDGTDLRGGQNRAPWSEQDIQMLTEAELRDVFKQDKRLQGQYNSVDNYISYMNDFMDIVDANPEQFNWWDSAVPYSIDTMQFAERYDLNDEDARMGSGERIDASKEAYRTSEERFNNLISSPEMSALRDKYNLTSQFQNSDGDNFTFNGINYSETYEVDDSEGRFIEPIMNLANTVALGLATGEVGSVLGPSLTGGTAASATASGTFAQGAVNNIIGGAINQGLTTGSIDASELATAGIVAGIGGVAEGIKTGELAGTAASDGINNLSELTGLSINETTDIVKNLATGAITGDDLEGIAIGAVQGFTSGQIKNVLSETFGDEIDIENVFDEGTTTIPTSALDSLVDTAVNAAFEGEVEVQDVLKSVAEYAQEGGSFGFLDPGLDLPDIDLDLFGNAQPFDFGDTPEEIKAIEDAVRAAGSATEDVVRTVGSTAEDIVRPIGSAAEDVVRTVGSAADDYIIQPIREAIPEVTAPDIDVNLPDIDLPEVDIALPEVDLPEVDIALPEVDLPEIDIALPEVDLPSVDLPSIDLPSIDFGMPQLAGGGGMFDPYSTNIGYSPVQLQQLITSPYGVQQPALKDYELAMNGILARNSGMMS
jgi:hypothetical protein